MNLLENLLIILITASFLLVATISTREATALRGASLISLPTSEAARRIENYAYAELPACYAELPGLDGVLTQAIVAIEYMEHSGLENLVESAWVKSATLLNISVPDLSLGPAQIRPSTVCRLLPQHDGCKGAQPNGEVALSLLDQCENIALAHDIVSAMLQRYQAGSNVIDAKVITSVAREYNGQKNDRMENLLYRTLVVQIVANNRTIKTTGKKRNG